MHAKLLKWTYVGSRNPCHVLVKYKRLNTIQCIDILKMFFGCCCLVGHKNRLVKKRYTLLTRLKITGVFDHPNYQLVTIWQMVTVWQNKFLYQKMSLEIAHQILPQASPIIIPKTVNWIKYLNLVQGMYMYTTWKKSGRQSQL